jgi:hypothetical protein
MSLKKNDENGKDRTASRLTPAAVTGKPAVVTSTAAASPAASTAPVSAPTATLAAKSTARKTPTQQDIALRAWEIWKSRGCRPGTDLENWLEAEKQLRSN